MTRSLLEELAALVPAASERIRPYVRVTPLEESIPLSRKDSTVFLKLENVQASGSFKIRGAANFLLQIPENGRRRGVVTASSGNHGAALAWLCRKLGIRGTVVVPETAAPSKVENLLRSGVEVRKHGEDCLLTEIEARRLADEEDRIYVPPYNDLRIIAGQGTVGLEIFQSLPETHTVFVPVGGGGLISGLASFMKFRNKGIQLIGCQPKNSAVMAESVRAGRLLDIPSSPTLADGTAGGIEPGSVTFDICRETVDEFVLVDELEIRRAVRMVLETHHILIEGAAALSVAAFLKFRKGMRKGPAVCVLTGRRIGLPDLRHILRENGNDD